MLSETQKLRSDLNRIHEAEKAIQVLNALPERLHTPNSKLVKDDDYLFRGIDERLEELSKMLSAAEIIVGDRYDDVEAQRA